jgi:CubicO group peptidase (beta-lactamase class C family)
VTAVAEGLRWVLDHAYPAPGPGAALGVYRSGELVASASVGLARLDSGPTVDAETPFEIASVSKQIGACALLSLARDGVVDLDADIREYVGEVGPQGITIRHCLQHTSGLPDYLTLAEIAGTDADAVCGFDWFLAALGTMTDLGFSPGTGIAYSNTGYVVAAIAAERAADRSWSQILAERVFDPLRMTSSSVSVRVGDGPPGAALSYTPGPDGFVVEGLTDGALAAGARHTIGDGEVLTTIADFAAWHGFLQDGRVLGIDLRDQLLERGRLADGGQTSYGLGLRHTRLGGTSAYGHSGSMWGFRAQSLTVPEAGIGVAVFANRADTDAEDLAWRAVRQTAEDGPWGRWLSTDALRTTHVQPTADGGLELDDGAERLTVRPAGPDSWIGRDELVRVDLARSRTDGAALVMIDEMGRRVPFERLESVPEPDADGLVGTFALTHPTARIQVRRAGAGLELCREDRPALPLRFLTRHAGSWVYAFAGGLALIAPGPRLTVATESAVVRDLARVTDDPAHP